MCGIWGYIGKHRDLGSLYSSFMKIQHRGPDRSRFLQVNEFVTFFLGFHRLAIMDKYTRGDQPFVLEWHNRTIYCLCNGEIYNYQELKEKYKLNTYSSSDCEVLPLIYEEIGFEAMIKELVGEFSIALVDIYHDTNIVNIYLARDPTGVRPLFYSLEDSTLAFSSELKGLSELDMHVKQFPPASIMTFNISEDETNMKITPYYNLDFEPIYDDNLSFDKEYLSPIFEKIRTTFESCVKQMLNSDRQLGALLSGGLDSSLVVSIASKYLHKQGKRLKTFSIGMNGSTDEKYARMVSKFCDTDHTHIEFSTQEFLDAIDDVICSIETYDITTIRASVGQWLVSKYIREHTDIKVLLIGDGSDELCSGYMYFHNAPTPEESHYENCRLLKELHLYDVLRADRGIATHGLEARVPFLNHKFIDVVMSIDPRLRIPINSCEKWLLRQSFEGYLPDEVLWRRKEAFSDGVSSKQNSWFSIIQQSMDEKYDEIPDGYPSKEAYGFKMMFDKMYPNCDHVVPHYWLPRWCGDISEPSARVLDIYEYD